jgi:hypothetical protein
VVLKIGTVETSARSSSPVLMPLPDAPSSDMRQFLFAGMEDAAAAAPAPTPAPRPPAAATVLEELARLPLAAPEEEPAEPVDPEPVMVSALSAIATDEDAAGKTTAVLFQDFQVRCRMLGLRQPPLDLAGFTRRLAAARAGIFEGLDTEWAPALEAGRKVPDDMLGAFLLIARAASENRPCPSDQELALVYGTSSLGRARRVLSYMEERDIIVARTDLAGRRSITIPALGWTTEPTAP